MCIINISSRIIISVIDGFHIKLLSLDVLYAFFLHTPHTIKWMDHWQRITHTNVKVDGKTIAYNTLCNVRLQYFLKVCICACVRMPLISFEMYSTIQNQQNPPVRACLRKHNKGHLFGNIRALALKYIYIEINLKLIFKYTLNTRLLFFIGWKLLFFSDIRWKSLFVVKSSCVYVYIPLFQKPIFPEIFRTELTSCIIIYI